MVASPVISPAPISSASARCTSSATAASRRPGAAAGDPDSDKLEGRAAVDLLDDVSEPSVRWERVVQAEVGAPRLFAEQGGLAEQTRRLVLGRRRAIADTIKSGAEPIAVSHQPRRLPHQLGQVARRQPSCAGDRWREQWLAPRPPPHAASPAPPTAVTSCCAPRASGRTLWPPSPLAPTPAATRAPPAATYSAAARAARREKTTDSKRLLLASRLAPCTPEQAASPQASRPGREVAPLRSVRAPPIM